MISIYLETDACVRSDTAPTFDHPSPGKSPKPSTKPFHKRGRPSIDKSKVSKPFPILTYDERELFDVMASGSVQERERRIPKAAERKVKINTSQLIEPKPQPKPKVSAHKPSQSWYTPTKLQSPPKGSLQRSVSNATPRTTASKGDVARTNLAKELRSHARAKSDTRRDCVGPAKRHVDKQSITHLNSPWLDSTDAPGDGGVPRRPLRSATGNSYESDDTVVEHGSLAVLDAVREKPALSKPVEDTLRPTVKLVSKPLPDLPVINSLSSRWSASTGSVYSDGDPFSYDRVLGMFPEPPKGVPSAAYYGDWENSALSTPAVFMSYSNSSSGSMETIVPISTLDPPSVKPLTLKSVPKPKVATVVHQNPRASCSFSKIQDSIAVHRARACPKASVKGSIHTPSIRTAGPAPTLRRRSLSLSSANRINPPNRVANIEALVWPHLRQTPEDIERIERARLERYKQYQSEQEKQQDLEQFEMEFGFNPHYKGKKIYERVVDPNGFELIRPEKKQRRWL